MMCHVSDNVLSNNFILDRESGAEFYCDDDIGDWSNLPVKIDTTNRCHLFCDKVTPHIHASVDWLLAPTGALGIRMSVRTSQSCLKLNVFISPTL